MLIGCLGAASSRATAAPIILPSLHPIATPGAISLELVPPDGAKVCTASIGEGGSASGRRFPIQLGGPSRRLSWSIVASGDGRSSLSVTCGASRRKPDSLGTTRREFELHGGTGRARLKIAAGSLEARRGFLPAHAPPARPAARASDFTEVDTSVARNCTNPYMTKAYAVGTGYATRIGFITKVHDTQSIGQMWTALEECVPFPPLTDSERDSLFKQMVCHDYYGFLPGAGHSWDFEAWREDPSWATALNPFNECQNWGNVPVSAAAPEFNGDIVQGSLDSSAQKKAWVILKLNGDWFRMPILTSKAFYCLKADGAPGPEVLAQDFLEDELPVGVGIGDEWCGAPAPPTPAPGSSSPTAPLPPGDYYVQYAEGGVYWRSGPDWNTAEATPGVGFYPGTVVRPTCYQQGAANVPGSADAMWEQATIISGPGSGSGWINEHFVADGQPINQPSPGIPPCASAPPPPPPATWSEQETPNHPVNTFTNYHNASGMGPAIAAGQWVQVSCKVYDPTIVSVNPDGYWYRIASSPWSNAYYSPANTFMNGDPYGGPYTHNTDFSVPDC
jgi:hypothetical protein